jgi:subtilisin family serine protease
VTIRITFILLLVFVYLSSDASPSQAQELAFVPGEILVQFRASVGLSAAEGVLQRQGLQVLEVSRYSGVMRVAVPPGREVELTNTLSAQPEIALAELNMIVSEAGPPNDSNFIFQWSLHNTGQIGGTSDADIDAPEAWNLQTGSRNVIIAIIDTGVKLTHEDLQAKIWLNSDEIGGNGLDDDSNGFIDDVRGWDFCNSPMDSSLVRCTSPRDNNPDDEDGHGTHVSGIAAAIGNNGRGIAGVSWGATVMPVKSLDAFGRGTTSTVAEGIYYAVANGADIINLSIEAAGTQFPCPNFGTVRLAMQQALSRGILVVVSSGNQNAPAVACPAALNEAFAVGATNYYDLRWEGSNYGPELDIVAPGDTIYSTSKTGQYEYLTGTSMAAPHVSGLAALLLSAKPGLSLADLRYIIQVSAEDLGSPGYDLEYSSGRINARYALEALLGLQTSPPQTFVLVDDRPESVPASRKIRLVSETVQPVTWQAAISPPVSWLSLAPPATGTISSASSPMALTLSVTRPVTYGSYKATVIITGTASSGRSLGARKTVVDVTYVPEATRFFLPLVVKKN